MPCLGEWRACARRAITVTCDCGETQQSQYGESLRRARAGAPGRRARSRRRTTRRSARSTAATASSAGSSAAAFALLVLFFILTRPLGSCSSRRPTMPSGSASSARSSAAATGASAGSSRARGRSGPRRRSERPRPRAARDRRRRAARRDGVLPDRRHHRHVAVRGQPRSAWPRTRSRASRSTRRSCSSAASATPARRRPRSAPAGSRSTSCAHDQVDHARAFVGRDAKRFEAVPHTHRRATACRSSTTGCRCSCARPTASWWPATTRCCSARSRTASAARARRCCSTRARCGCCRSCRRCRRPARSRAEARGRRPLRLAGARARAADQTPGIGPSRRRLA